MKNEYVFISTSYNTVMTEQSLQFQSFFPALKALPRSESETIHSIFCRVSEKYDDVGKAFEDGEEKKENPSSFFTTLRDYVHTLRALADAVQLHLATNHHIRLLSKKNRNDVIISFLLAQGLIIQLGESWKKIRDVQHFGAEHTVKCQEFHFLVSRFLDSTRMIVLIRG